MTDATSSSGRNGESAAGARGGRAARTGGRGVSFLKPATPPAQTGEPVPRPRLVVIAISALAVTALGVIIASASLFFLRSWLISSTEDSNNNRKKGDKHLTHQQILDQVHSVPRSQALASAVLVLALLFVAYAAFRGRYWSRWGVIGLWVLSSFTGTLGSLNYIFSIGKDVPLAFKLPTALGALAFVVAVVCVVLPKSGAYFNQNRPARPAGAPARGGLFGPRPTAGRPTARDRATAARAGAATRAEATTRPAAADAEPVAASAAAAGPDRSRAKKRATDAHSIAKGAELARTRAKAASKSRRTEA